MKFRSLIGQRIEWRDPASLLHPVRSGVIEDVRGHNVMIDGDWKWGPTLRSNGARVIPHQAPRSESQSDESAPAR